MFLWVKNSYFSCLLSILRVGFWQGLSISLLPSDLICLKFMSNCLFVQPSAASLDLRAQVFIRRREADARAWRRYSRRGSLDLWAM